MIHLERRGPEGRVALVTIDRQHRRNALDAEALAELATAIADVQSGSRVIVLCGAGGHFCAGADLTDVEGPEFASQLRRVLDAMVEAPVPLIAAVEGAALGAGMQLAVACDLRIATPDARLGVPAAKLGLMVDHWTVQRLAGATGQSPAAAMLLGAETFDGEAAHRLGLVHRLGQLDDALAWAHELSELAPLTIAGHKLMLNRLQTRPGRDPDVDAAFDRAWASADLAEGRAAFTEGRRPRFTGQ